MRETLIATTRRDELCIKIVEMNAESSTDSVDSYLRIITEQFRLS